jgi:hypothetical protein
LGTQSEDLLEEDDPDVVASVVLVLEAKGPHDQLPSSACTEAGPWEIVATQVMAIIRIVFFMRISCSEIGFLK